LNTIKTKISDINVLIEVFDDAETGEDSNADHDNPLGDTRRTSGRVGGSVKKTAEQVAENVLESAANVIFAFADVCRKRSEGYNNAPDELDVEYALTFDIKTNLWVFTSGANSAVKVRMKWKKN